MLKNTEKYLKEELLSVRKELKREIEISKERKINYEYHNEVLTTWKNIQRLKKSIKDYPKLIGVLLLAILFFSIICPSNISKWIAYSICGSLECLFIFAFIMEIKDYQKERNKFKNFEENSKEDFRILEGENVPVLQYKVNHEKNLVEESNKDISAFYEYINIIEDILKSEDCIDKIVKYKEEKGYFSDALLAEWNAYLEEIKHFKPENVDFTMIPITEECYKAATEHLHVDIKKLEKSLYN
ncbi:MAG: hypothetical protein K2G03_05805, partial [Bacilli bacterium]|nr:hypothetical protein [Bacilli bacterium]